MKRRSRESAEERSRAALKLNAAARETFEARNGPIPTKIKVISEPSEREFTRKYLERNRPVLIRGAFEHWGARKKWDFDYLERKLGDDKKVSVNVMPVAAGSGTIVGPYHVDPKKVTMRFNDFTRLLKDDLSAKGGKRRKSKSKSKSKSRSKGGKRGGKKGKRRSGGEEVTGAVGDNKYYISSNTNNFKKQYPELAKDVNMNGFDFISSFKIDSVNMWMGGKGCKSPVHNDYLENLFCVVRGQKTMLLFHPLDSVYMYESRFRKGHFEKKKDGSWYIKETNPLRHQEWVAVDPEAPDHERHPLFRYANPIEVTINEGDMLYLPHSWYHLVKQDVDDEGKCIAVNLWFSYDEGEEPWHYDLFSNMENQTRALLGERYIFDGSSSYSEDPTDSSSYSSTGSSIESLESETTFDPLKNV